MQLDFLEPQLAVFNYKDAMNAEPSADVEGKINFGYDSSKSQISFKVQFIALSLVLDVFIIFRNIFSI